MRQKHLSALGPHGLHRLAYREWGDPANPRVLVCVHGLTRNGQDFQWLAETLAADWRVVAPDMPGRGDSDWLPVKTDYDVPLYMADCTALIARLDVEEVTWLGTSMGGIIGMSLASLPGSPIKRLILNDVGPSIPAAGLQRIAGYVGDTPHFTDLDAAEAWTRVRMADFGIRSDADWRQFAAINTRPAPEGGLRTHYDAGIAHSMQGEIKDAVFWPVWGAITCPTLVLRGQRSDILTAETAQLMSACGPKATVVEFPDCGHAPALVDPVQIAAVAGWLKANAGSSDGKA